MAPRLLIFDLDGTLIDSSLDICNAVNATLEHLKKPILPHYTIASYIGDGAAMLLHRALEDNGDLAASPPDDILLQAALDYFIRYYRVHKLDNTRLYAGVLEALTKIRDAYPQALMAVLTNKPVGPSRAICRELAIASFFFQNYGGDSFLTKKPDPHGCKTLMAEANEMLIARGEPSLQVSDVVFVGDSAVDVLTALGCGVRSIGCTFGIRPQEMIAAGPDFLAEHAGDWIRLLQDLFA
jgi:phosphoglycolate phosphatase